MQIEKRVYRLVGQVIQKKAGAPRMNLISGSTVLYDNVMFILLNLCAFAVAFYVHWDAWLTE